MCLFLLLTRSCPEVGFCFSLCPIEAKWWLHSEIAFNAESIRSCLTVSSRRPWEPDCNSNMLGITNLFYLCLFYWSWNAYLGDSIQKGKNIRPSPPGQIYFSQTVVLLSGGLFADGLIRLDLRKKIWTRCYMHVVPVDFLNILLELPVQIFSQASSRNRVDLLSYESKPTEKWE